MVPCEFDPNKLSHNQHMNIWTPTVTPAHTGSPFFFFYPLLHPLPQHLIRGFVWDSLGFTLILPFFSLRLCVSLLAGHMHIITYHLPPTQSLQSSSETKSCCWREFWRDYNVPPHISQTLTLLLLLWRKWVELYPLQVTRLSHYDLMPSCRWNTVLQSRMFWEWETQPLCSHRGRLWLYLIKSS